MAEIGVLMPVYGTSHRDRMLKSAMEVRWNSFLTLLMRNIEQRAAIDKGNRSDALRSESSVGRITACCRTSLAPKI